MPVISTNTAANSALRYLKINASDDTAALSKLASGSKIAKASDDAAGLAVGSQLQSDVAVLSQAATNASRAQSVLQTADGGQARISEVLQRMKSLAAQSLSDSVSRDDRKYIADEFSGLNAEVTSIAKGTKSNGAPLLDGSYQGADFVIGAKSSDKVSVSFGDLTSGGLGIDKLDVSGKEGATAALTALDDAIGRVSDGRAQAGAAMGRLELSRPELPSSIQSAGKTSPKTEADISAEKSSLAMAKVKTQAAIAALAQTNAMPKNLVDLLR